MSVAIPIPIPHSIVLPANLCPQIGAIWIFNHDAFADRKWVDRALMKWMDDDIRPQFSRPELGSGQWAAKKSSFS